MGGLFHVAGGQYKHELGQNSFQQKGLSEGMDFVFLIGLDGDYNYLKEILFWDPVSASWYDMS